MDGAMSGSTSVMSNGDTNETNIENDKHSIGSEKDRNAIRLFEKAIEKESHGLMSEAVGYYRKAFKINDQVDLLYRKEKLPQTVKKIAEQRGKNSVQRVDENIVKKINVDELLLSFRHVPILPPDPLKGEGDAPTIKFANLGLEDDIPYVEPISPLLNLPEDIWLSILETLIISSPESWFNFSITCKKLAYLGFQTSNIWRLLCNLVYMKQVYTENQMYLANTTAETETSPNSLPIPQDQLLILPQYNNSWKQMLRERPFIKFNGCYISVVNYYSEGGKQEFSSSWTNPVRTITYYRYLRFYPDGTCCKILSNLEPPKVVPNLLRNAPMNSIMGISLENIKQGNVSVKENHKIYIGSWDISTTGQVQVKITEGSVPYYKFYYIFQIKNLGGIFKHGKLNWVEGYAIRKKMSEDDDREGERVNFSMKNETAFKFLRVKSYSHNN